MWSKLLLLFSLLLSSSATKLECEIVSGSSTHVLAWTGDDLEGCSTYAAKLTTALDECPCDANKCSSGLECGSMDNGGIHKTFALTPAKEANPACEYTELAIARGVKEWAQHQREVEVSACFGFVS
jgi:hypothetical protein